MQRIYLQEVDSTNDYLKSLQKLEEDMVFVFAEEQTKGRGYLDNKWVSTKGESLTFSFALEIPKAFDYQKFNFWLSNSIADFFIKKFNLDLKLKWPNDLFVNDKKMGGILIEQKHGIKSRIVAGIGVNINQVAFSDFPDATSLFLLIDKKFDAKDLFDDLSVFLYLSYLNFAFTTEIEFLDNYNKKLYAKNQIRKFLCNDEHFIAKIVSVDQDGLLELDLGDGTIKKYKHKEVSLVLS